MDFGSLSNPKNRFYAMGMDRDERNHMIYELTIKLVFGEVSHDVPISIETDENLEVVEILLGDLLLVLPEESDIFKIAHGQFVHLVKSATELAYTALRSRTLLDSLVRHVPRDAWVETLRDMVVNYVGIETMVYFVDFNKIIQSLGEQNEGRILQH